MWFISIVWSYYSVNKVRWHFLSIKINLVKQFSPLNEYSRLCPKEIRWTPSAVKTGARPNPIYSFVWPETNPWMCFQQCLPDFVGMSSFMFIVDCWEKAGRSHVKISHTVHCNCQVCLNLKSYSSLIPSKLSLTVKTIVLIKRNLFWMMT